MKAFDIYGLSEIIGPGVAIECEGQNGLHVWADHFLPEVIDPATGKIEGKIDLSGLLKKEDQHPKIDYLNGIAWDRQNNRIFVTGKNWPKLFEVKFVRIE